jgi:DNA-directed RNA polymerase subunit M/transcription elongation factor TFIIS
MPLQQPSSPPPPIERRDCPKCGTQMMLARIEPQEPGVDLQTFECPKCNHAEERAVPFL